MQVERLLIIQTKAFGIHNFIGLAEQLRVHCMMKVQIFSSGLVAADITHVNFNQHKLEIFQTEVLPARVHGSLNIHAYEAQTDAIPY